MALKLYYEPREPVSFRPAWRRADPDIERDAEAFWRQESLLTTETPLAQRLSELCMAAYDEYDTLIAVSTARILHVAVLGCKLAMFRCAVADSKRRSRLATIITGHSRELLEQWSLANPDEAVMGMMTITQTNAFDSRLQRGMFRGSHLGFIGWNTDGHPMRVAWFEHARIPAKMPTGARPRSFS